MIFDEGKYLGKGFKIQSDPVVTLTKIEIMSTKSINTHCLHHCTKIFSQLIKKKTYLINSWLNCTNFYITGNFRNILKKLEIREHHLEN